MPRAARWRASSRNSSTCIRRASADRGDSPDRRAPRTIAGELAATRAEIEQRQQEHERAEEQAAILAERAAETSESLPEAEKAWRDAQGAVAAVQAEISRHEQSAQLEESHISHADRVMEQLKARELRLIQEKENLAALDEAHLARQEADLEETQERIASLGEYLATARAELPGLQAAQAQAAQVRELARRDLGRQEAELAALHKMQCAAQQSESEGAAWLARVGLEAAPRLWQSIRVEAGWETAVEAALGDAMAALAVEVRDEWLAQPPEARFEFVLSAAPQAAGEFALLPAEAGFQAA
jgi:chromosome segregation protein